MSDDKMRGAFKAALDNLVVGIGDPKENARVVWEAYQARDAEVAELVEIADGDRGTLKSLRYSAEIDGHVSLVNNCSRIMDTIDQALAKHKKEG